MPDLNDTGAAIGRYPRWYYCAERTLDVTLPDGCGRQVRIWYDGWISPEQVKAMAYELGRATRLGEYPIEQVLDLVADYADRLNAVQVTEPIDKHSTSGARIGVMVCLKPFDEQPYDGPQREIDPNA